MVLSTCHCLGTVFYILFLFLFLSLPTTQVPLNFLAWNCEYTNGNYTQNSTYNSNLLNVFSNLTSLSSFNTFSNLTAGADTDKVYALYHCRQDFTTETCHRCVENGTRTILQLCPTKEGTILFEQCILQYANRMIFSTVEINPLYRVHGPRFGFDGGVINQTVETIFEGIIDEAANSSRYLAIGEGSYLGYQKLYCFVECRPDLSKNSCKECLVELLNFTLNCANNSRLFCAFIAPSCRMVYDVFPFFNVSSNFPPMASPSGLPPAHVHGSPSHASDPHLFISTGSLTFSLLLFIVLL